MGEYRMPYAFAGPMLVSPTVSVHAMDRKIRRTNGETG